MSTTLPPRPKGPGSSGQHRFAIVASEYNPEFVQALVNNTCKELYTIEESCGIELFSVPGAFEIPLAVELVARRHRHNAVIALGLLMQGATPHANFICQNVTTALMDIALKHEIPVIHEVLLVNSEAEAYERCVQKEINRGIEAARAAFFMARVVRDLIPHGPRGHTTPGRDPRLATV